MEAKRKKKNQAEMQRTTAGVAQDILTGIHDPARWFQRHIITLYVGLVTWIFFGRIGEAFGASAAVEVADWIAAMTVGFDSYNTLQFTSVIVKRLMVSNKTMANRLDAALTHWMWADLFYRLATLVVGIFMGVLLAWAAEFAPFEGQLRFAAWTILVVILVPTRAWGKPEGFFLVAFAQVLGWLMGSVGELFDAETITYIGVGVFLSILVVVASIAVFYTLSIPPSAPDEKAAPNVLIPAALLWVVMIFAWGIVIIILWAVNKPDVSELRRLIR